MGIFSALLINLFLALNISCVMSKKKSIQPESTIKELFANTTFDSMSPDQKKLVGEIFWSPIYNTYQAEMFPLGGNMFFELGLPSTQENIRAIKAYQTGDNQFPLRGANFEPGLDAADFPWARQSCELGRIGDDATKLAQILKQYGINVNFAPVADVGRHPQSVVYRRVYSDDPQKAADCVAQTVGTFAYQGVQSTLKHYPGHGGVAGDTHAASLTDGATRDYIQGYYLPPFQAGINAGSNILMVSHIIYNQWDNFWPASLSLEILGYLKNNMGFKGVVVTDAMEMNGVSGLYSVNASINGHNYSWRDLAGFIAFMHGNDMIMEGDTRRLKITYALFFDALQAGAHFTVQGKSIDFSPYQVCERYRDAALRIDQVRAKMKMGTHNRWQTVDCNRGISASNPGIPGTHSPGASGEPTCSPYTNPQYITCLNNNPYKACLGGKVFDCNTICRSDNPHKLDLYHDICSSAPVESRCNGFGDWTTCLDPRSACVGGRVVSCPKGCQSLPPTGTVGLVYHDRCQ